ncbi:hypothetical protein [Bacillus timonensis]|nr:hypothetical protein [Bacillus timonensis]
MKIVILAIIVGAVGVIIFKAVSKKKLPSNHYAPFDDVTMGKKNEP